MCSSNQNNILTIVSICIAVCGLFLSLFVFYKNSKTDKVSQVVSACNFIYQKTFELRSEISKQIGRDFYFDLETMKKDKHVKIMVLDHLTLMENSLYKIMQLFRGKKMFCKMTSLNLYLCMLSLYPFILYTREINKDNTKFKCYDSILQTMQNLKKIKKALDIKDNICWVGIRKSDILYSKNINENITFFGSENSYFRDTRGNQNQNNLSLAPFIKNRIQEVKKINDGKVKFIFYNSINAYKGDLTQGDVLGANDKLLLEQLNDKIHMKFLFKDIIPQAPSKTILGNEFNFEKYSELLSSNALIIQSNHGGGGIGTFLVTVSNSQEITSRLKPNGKYIVSSYIPNAISINVHIVIAEKQVVLSPASIQIIELVENQLVYRGADFISFRSFDKSLQENIRQYCLKISDKLRAMGYKGVAGIDLMVDENNNIYFCEINPRFQASSLLIDQFLSKKLTDENTTNLEAKTLLDMQISAFNGYLVSSLNFYDEINASCYYYYNDNDYTMDEIKYKQMVLIDKLNDNFLDDGFSVDAKIEKNGYLFRAIFPHKITEISPEHDLWISDNIRLEKNNVQDKLMLKIALMNQGISKVTSTFSESWKRAVYSSIDIYVMNYDLYVNCPIDINYAKYSPFNIKFELNEYNLYCYDKFISKIKIENDVIKDIKLSSGVNLDRIIYYSTDRMRIKLNNGCDFKNSDLGCKFCDMPLCTKKFTLEELKEAFDLSDKSKYEHILIGGGTSLSDNSWDIIAKTASYIKSKDNKMNISLMSIPPKEEMLTLLKSAGIDEVCFNMEIYDEELAKKLMPGKSQKNRKEYIDILNKAIEIWPEKNAVRTAFVIGFETKKTILEGIRFLLRRGIQPVFSVFRPLPKAELKNHLAPTNEYLYNLYMLCETECEKFNNELGPKCKLCRNNTLSL